MFPIRTILHPTDFSEHSRTALHMACALARDHGAQIILLHVVVPPVVVYGEMASTVPPPDSLKQEFAERLRHL
jgi:nucleotide-binding universal stress UspA family protein